MKLFKLISLIIFTIVLLGSISSFFTTLLSSTDTGNAAQTIGYLFGRFTVVFLLCLGWYFIFKSWKKEKLKSV